MSMSALLQGVEAELINAVAALDATNCKIRGGDGQPPAKFGGRLFLAIVPMGWSPGPSGVDGFNTGLDETYTIDLVASYRTGHIPEDMLMGKAFIDATKGLEPFARSVMVVMRNNRYTDGAAGGILTRANTLISGADEIVEPLRWLGNDTQPTPVGAEWFSGSGEDPRAYGWRFTMHYGDCRRPQTEANLE